MEYLNVSNTLCTGSGFVHLTNLKNLRDLEIGQKTSEAYLKHIAALPNLETLRHYRGILTATGVSHLSNCKKLTLLDLRYSTVNDVAMKPMGKINSLKILILEDTKVTTAGIAYLTGLENLETLYLRGNAITDAVFESLKKMKSLKKVDLTGTRVTDEAIRKFNAK